MEGPTQLMDYRELCNQFTSGKGGKRMWVILAIIIILVICCCLSSSSIGAYLFMRNRTAQ